jgi:hypothetical protein
MQQHDFAPKTKPLEGIEARREMYRKLDPEGAWEPEPDPDLPPPSKGVKWDQGKPMAGLLLDFRNTLMKVAEAGTFGAAKYGRTNWKDVERIRYLDAAMRHILQEGDDPETGLPHMIHAIWNMMAYMERRESNDD